MYLTTWPDILHPQIVRPLQNNIAGPLTHISNNLVETGIIHEDWSQPTWHDCCSHEIKQSKTGKLLTHLSCFCSLHDHEEISNHTLGNGQLMGDSQHRFGNKHNCQKSRLNFFAQVIDTYDTNNNIKRLPGFSKIIRQGQSKYHSRRCRQFGLKLVS